MAHLRIAVLASGRGSNFEAILTAITEERLKAEIGLVMSNKSKAGALEIARNHNIPAVHFSIKQYDSQEEFDYAFLKLLHDYEINLIILAGYLKMISPVIIKKYKNRILNIHPALLPSFGGKGLYGHYVHEAIIEYGCKVSGVTVHLVDEEYDTGPIVMQRCVPVEENDTPDTLAARVLKQEHKIYAEAIQLFADDRVLVEGRRVKILTPSQANS
jgi:phosphoribosylglycinamide formyltransferase-1